MLYAICECIDNGYDFDQNNYLSIILKLEIDLK